MSRSLGLREDQQDGARLVARINALFPADRVLFVARELAVVRELAVGGGGGAPGGGGGPPKNRGSVEPTPGAAANPPP
ncbi:hypothetical protein M2399_001032, partial [Pseudomonas sp. BIGb0450]|nr:hypothetical protein [Pseudomonas sp. BIGb0450]